MSETKSFWDIEVEERTFFSTNNIETRSFDVVIIGGGGGGLTAAARAVEAGAKNIALLEKNKQLGGCTKIAMGIFAVESNAQKRLGINHTADECFTRHMYISNWACNSRLVRKWMNESGNVMNWLESHGIEFDIVGSCSGPIKTYHMSHYQTGKSIVEKLTDFCGKNDVAIMTETRATHIKKDDKGVVCAVEAVVAGKPVTIFTKSVVIATGSMSANKELIRRFFPCSGYDEVKIMAAMPFSTGDGLIMAEEAGAQIGKISVNYIGPHNHPRDVLVGCMIRRPHMMIVNKKGERYINEDLFGQGEFGWMSGKAMDEQPEKTCFPIMDEACLRDMIANKECCNEVEGNQSRHSEETGILMTNVDTCAWLDKVEARFLKEYESDMMGKFDALDEVADWIGCSPSSLKETVALYNSSCEKGHDDEFLKNPKYLYPVRSAPFYVFKGLHGIDNFIGGIKVNDRLEVVDNNFNPIPGLYAAGIATSGWLGQGYGHAGTEMGLTMFSGYESGYAAAKYGQTLVY